MTSLSKVLLGQKNVYHCHGCSMCSKPLSNKCLSRCGHTCWLWLRMKNVFYHRPTEVSCQELKHGQGQCVLTKVCGTVTTVVGCDWCLISIPCGFFFKDLFTCVFYGVLSTCLSAHQNRTLAHIIDSCELPCECWNWTQNLGEEQPPESVLQPPHMGAVLCY